MQTTNTNSSHTCKMEYRTFEVTLNSASDLPDVRLLGQMKVYAKVSIKGQSESEYINSPTDKNGETNPVWNFKIHFGVPEKAVQQEGSVLSIKLYGERSLKHDKYVGEVKLSLKGLFDSGLEKENKEFSVECKDAKGGFPKLILSYKFGTTTFIKNVDHHEEKSKKKHFNYEKLGAIASAVGAAVGTVGVAVTVML